ncbi:MAG: hypothetical protein WCY46_05820 [Tissierellaceae bacterium]
MCRRGLIKTIVMVLIMTMVLASSALGVNNTASASGLTVIGSGESARSDGKATEVSFNNPFGIAYSEKLNALIIADTGNHRIASLDLKTMEVKTIAGLNKGEDRFGFPGGGYVDGSLDKAMFNRPRGVAVAENGSIFVADTGNHAIRQIFDGKVTTIAGGKIAGYKDGKGLEASFLSPSSLALDEDKNIFVADTLNNTIRKIDKTGKVTTFAGKLGDDKLLNEPIDLFFDEDGKLYVVDGGNHQIKRLNDKGKIDLVWGNHSIKDDESHYWLGGYLDGPGQIAYFNFPKGITGGKDGAILVSDSYNHVIREIKDSNVSTILGTGLAGEKEDKEFKIYLDGPTGLAYGGGKLFISDRWNNRIIVIPDKGKNLSSISPRLVGDNIVLYLNGSLVEFPDVEPMVIEDVVRVPIRALVEAVEGEIKWNDETQEVDINLGGYATTLSHEEGDFILYQGRSLLDLKALEGIMDLEVKYLEEEKIISVQMK